MRPVVVAFLMSALTTPVAAQWLNHPTPGIPRTPDGKPNLSAPAPRTPDGKPDLSGLWDIRTGPGGGGFNASAYVKPGDLLPWADALYRERLGNLGIDDPADIYCLPEGPRLFVRSIAKIVQTPSLVVILYEEFAYRQVFLDGRTLPHDPNPAFMGYSVGHWEGETLVVESAGFNERTWLDPAGHPHSEALRVTERFRRLDYGRMAVQVRFDDPKTYARPFEASFVVRLMPDTELLEYICAENTKSRPHLVGRTAEEKKVTVDPAVLATYAGVYEVPSATNPSVAAPYYTVTLAGRELELSVLGGGKTPLVPLSQTSFGHPSGTFEFVLNDQGVVTHLAYSGAGGGQRAVRRR